MSICKSKLSIFFVHSSVLFWLALLIALCNLIPLLPFGIYVSQDRVVKFYIYAFIYGAAALTPVFVLPAIRFIYIPLLYLVLLATGAIYAAHIYMYKAVPSAVTLQVICETNLMEAVEFLGSVIPLWLVGVLGVSFLVTIYPLYKSLKLPYPRIQVRLSLASLFVCLTAVLMVSDAKQKIRYYVTGTYYSWKDYHRQIARLEALSKGLCELPEKVELATNTPAIGVLVIGESAVRNHLGVYGYFRNTTPYTEKRKNIIWFQDVISAHGQTGPALEKLLTFATLTSPEPQCTLFDICTAAGVRSSWVSNQPVYSDLSTMVTALASRAEKQFFLSMAASCKASAQYDEVTLPVVIDLVDTGQEDAQLLVVHLLGSHTTYSNRFPQKFRKFAPLKEEPYRVLSDEQARVVADYDNSILYTDYIISSLIDKLEQSGKRSFLLYLSDHGEELYEIDGNIGHREAPYRAFFDIPFMVWMSDEYMKSRPDLAENMATYATRSHQVDNLIYGICDLLGIQFSGFDQEKNIFSPVYKERKRIAAGADYDRLPK